MSLRPEPPGAFVYDSSTRRLSVLKTLRLLDVVRRLDGRTEVEAELWSAGVAEDECVGYLKALVRLATNRVLIRSTS